MYIVTQPFGDYQVGDTVKDIEAVKAAGQLEFCVQVADQPEPIKTETPKTAK